MTEPTAAAFLELIDGRRGHFQLESGYHAGLWLDLDPLFSVPRRVAPFVSALADALRPYRIEVVCGPLLGGAFLAQLLARELDSEFCFTTGPTFGEADGLYRARYRLPPAFASRVNGRRVVIVDDVMSAGSSLRSTYRELLVHGAITVVAGALLLLGTKGEECFAACGIPVQAAVRDEFQLWLPSECPLCAEGLPIDHIAIEAARDSSDPGGKP
jgi:orotate phosphoribosyltransferase